MSTRNLTPVLPAFTVSGNSPLTRSYQEAASQTFKKGEAVYIDAAGQIAEYTASVDDGTQRFLGYAAEDAHNDSVAGTHEVLVWIACDDTIFSGNIYHGTVGSAITALTDLATLLPMKQLTATGTGIIAVDKENTAGQMDCLRIVDFDRNHTIGDTYGRVLFAVEAVGRQFFQ